MPRSDYHIARHTEGSEWYDGYSMLKGPNGFECLLTEPEDRTWYRDGAGVINELNRLYKELRKARATILNLKGKTHYLESQVEEADIREDC